MRVYTPDKSHSVINEVLKDLYLLKKEIDYGSGTADSKIRMIDMIRNKLQELQESSEA